VCGGLRGPAGPQGILERENRPQKLHRERPIRAPTPAQQEHAVGETAEQKKHQTAQSSRTHQSTAPEPVPALRETGAVRTGEEPHEAFRAAHCGIR
ncbi:hypothetical protein M9458_011049, partial [Cirrhinus mrigala]